MRGLCFKLTGVVLGPGLYTKFCNGLLGLVNDNTVVYCYTFARDKAIIWTNASKENIKILRALGLSAPAH